MNVLPDEIIDNIYKFKHNFELKDVHEELMDNHDYKIRKIVSLKNLFLNMHMDWYEPITLIHIYTAMKNEGYIEPYVYDLNISNLLTINNMMSQTDRPDIEIKDDPTISFTYILNEFEDFIDDALRQQDLAEDWINENVM